MRLLDRDFAVWISLALIAVGVVALTSTKVGTSTETENAAATVGRVSAGELAPGDAIEQDIDLDLDETHADARISLTTEIVPTSRLATHATTGLQLQIALCDTACSDVRTVVSPRPILVHRLTLPPSVGIDSKLRIRVSLPAGAGNELQGLAASIRYTFTAE